MPVHACRSLRAARRVAAIALVLGAAAARRAHGEEAEGRAWAIGGRAAWQRAALSSSGYEARQSFAIGAILVAARRPLVQGGPQLEAGAILSDKRVGRGVEGGTEVVRMRYIELPVLLRLSGRGSAARPYFLAGPVLSLLLDAHIWIDAPTVHVDREHAGIASTDVALLVGAGVEVPLGSVAPIVDIRYAHGFGAVADDAGGAQRSRVLAVSAGALF